MNEMLEHPDITSALETGYPSWGQCGPVLRCEICDGEVYEGGDYYHTGVGDICPACMAGMRRTAGED